jgi:hypothetical protein
MVMPTVAKVNVVATSTTVSASSWHAGQDNLQSMNTTLSITAPLLDL